MYFVYCDCFKWILIVVWNNIYLCINSDQNAVVMSEYRMEFVLSVSLLCVVLKLRKFSSAQLYDWFVCSSEIECGEDFNQGYIQSHYIRTDIIKYKGTNALSLSQKKYFNPVSYTWWNTTFKLA